MNRRPVFASVGALVCIGLAVVFIGMPAPDAVFHPERALPPGTTMAHGSAWYRPFGALYTVHDVQLRQGGATTSIGTIAITGLRQGSNDATMRQFDARDIAGTAPDATHYGFSRLTMDHVQWPRAIAPGSEGALRAIAPRLRAGHVVADGFSATVRTGSITMRHAEVSDLADGRMGRFAAAGIGMTLNLPLPATAIALSIDSVEMRNTRLPGVDGFGLFSGDRARIAAALPLGSTSSSNVHGLKLSGNAFHLAMPDLTSATTMDQAGTLRAEGGAPSFDFDVLIPRTQLLLSGVLGLNAITGATTVNEAFATATNGAALSITIDVAQLGTLREDFQATFAPAENAPQFIAGAVFGGAKIVWKDHGLIDRVVDYVAARRSVPAAQLRAGIAAALTARLNPLLADQPDSNAQLANFIAHPGTLTFASTPAQPVAVVSLKGHSAAEIAGMLDLHLSSD